MGRRGENGGKGTVNKKHKWLVQNRQADSMGNGEAKELLCTTHGHELRGWGEKCSWEGGAEERRIERRKMGKL